MDNTFDHLPETSRIWIYQCDRKFSGTEEAEINDKAARFVRGWNAHGSELHAGAKVMHHQFVILSVDENKIGASGCSIDKSVRFIRELENAYDIRLLDRSKIAYYSEEKVLLASFTELKIKIDDGSITGDTLIFNNLVDRKGDLEGRWIIPARESWIKKYINSN